MKHNKKITILLLSMFVLTPIIGLVVLNADVFTVDKIVNGTIEQVPNPYLSFISPPQVETAQESASMFGSLIIAFIFAICIFFLLTKFKIKFIFRLWFFVVVAIALFLSILSFEKIIPISINLNTAVIIGLAIALPLAFIKIYKRNFLIHNLTELFIYPGIAIVFVPILNIYTIIILLILISLYDMWAVWHSGIMQKMATYQIDKLNIFSGFFVPYANKKTKEKIKSMKQKFSKKELRKKKIKINLAILGGGDIVFPIITAGVLLNAYGFLPAILAIVGATLGLTLLFIFSEKKKFYPAMPFITAGIFLGMLASLIIHYL